MGPRIHAEIVAQQDGTKIHFPYIFYSNVNYRFEIRVL